MNARKVTPARAAVESREAAEPKLRIHNAQSNITLIYLPGVHGDWTLVGGFRRALGKDLCFVEITYPRTENWSLEDYAGSIEQALDQAGIHEGWLLGESFGSQVAWEIVKRGSFAVEGLVLAGGFARHPAPWMAQVATLLAGKPSLSVLRLLLKSYAHVARFRFRYSPETLASIQEFIERRTELDWRAIRHRLKLVAQNDPRTIAREVQVPVYALTGLVDPIVPWHAARKWLRRHCQSLRGHRVIWRADHNVLGTAPEEAAAQVLAWLRQPLPGLRHLADE